MYFVIPLNAITKKNHQQIIRNKYTGKPLIIQSKQYLQFEKDCKWFMPKYETIDYPINIKYTFYMKDNRLCDLSNLIASIDDILVKYKVIQDDNYKIIVGHDFSRVYVDKNKPRIEVEIERVN